MNLKSIFSVVIVLAIVSCSKVDDIPRESERYGVLRIPLISSCKDKVKDIENSLIERIEIVSFDLKIYGSNVDSLLYLQHKGTPAEVLNYIAFTLKGGLPNKLVKYDNEPAFIDDLQNYLTVSKQKPVFIEIQNGDIGVAYQDE